MNARERILTTLEHEEPDKIPYHENLIQNPGLAKRLNLGKELNSNMDQYLAFMGRIKKVPNLINKLINKIVKRPGALSFVVKKVIRNYFDFYTYLGVDLGVFPIGPYSYFKYIPPNKLINEFGAIYELKTIGGTFGNYYIGGAIQSEEIYDKFPKLDSEQLLGLMMFKAIKKKVDKEQKIYVVPGIFNGLFDSISLALGIEYFSKVLIKNQSFLKKIISDREKFFLELIKKALDETNSEIFMIGDDLAYNSGPFISPRFFNKLFLPSYKRISKAVHKRGAKLIFHSDGDIRPLMTGIIECFDSIHPLQASANIDIFEFKEQYGDKICLEGNVPIEMLVHGKIKEIKEYVKKLIKICGPNGGYILSSGNSIVPEIPYINYYTMLSTFKKYRNYPIKVI
ncbi:MAG: uroporphyrinogen decarboxylase family protein [Promethearchaeota archaeon]